MGENVHINEVKKGTSQVVQYKTLIPVKGAPGSSQQTIHRSSMWQEDQEYCLRSKNSQINFQ